MAISLAALLIALAIALPAGLYVGHTRRGTGVAVGMATIGRAVPSLALIGLVLPITQAFDPVNGFALYPTIFAMIVLAIPPVLVNVDAGIRGVDPDVVQAARGMGLTERQVLRRIEVPLSLAVILGGVRSSTVQVIATVTLGALFALGGLGRFIVDGIAQNDDGMLFGGVVLVGALAMTAEGAARRPPAVGIRASSGPEPGPVRGAWSRPSRRRAGRLSSAGTAEAGRARAGRRWSGASRVAAGSRAGSRGLPLAGISGDGGASSAPPDPGELGLAEVERIRGSSSRCDGGIVGLA